MAGLQSLARQPQHLQNELEAFEDQDIYRLENGFVRLVVDPVPERVVDSIIFSFARTNILRKKKKKRWHLKHQLGPPSEDAQVRD